MANTRLDFFRQVFILAVGVLGVVLVVVGLLIGDAAPVVVGVIFVVACLMGENLSHFSAGKGRLLMRSRAPVRKSTGTSRPRRPPGS